MATEPQPHNRRSSRLNFRCRVKIGSLDAQGRRFSEETETVCISKFGASLKTKHTFKMHQTLTVYTVDRGHTGQFQVVWIGKDGTPEEGQIGIEWLNVRRFWGIEFPPEDWSSEALSPLR